MTNVTAEIGVFGGSGFYSLLEGAKELVVQTPYGPTSDNITVGEIGGRRVAFLPRHGRRHHLPPHKINYAANVFAFKQLGVTQIVGPCASGSLQPDVKPGDFVLCDQYVDRTCGRIDTFYHGPITTHVSAADPYCPKMRDVAAKALKKLKVRFHDKGTVVVIQGPRFSTRAESKWFQGQGWEVINMTQYPEAHLARELELCYLNISLITDYDTGLEGRPDIKPVSHDEVIHVFNENNEKLKKILAEIIPNLPVKRECHCVTALKGARF
jgi:5'-methylthioadenosine phosphorylase